MNESILLKSALHYLELGFSIIPLGPDKRPAIIRGSRLMWQKYQQVAPTKQEVINWFQLSNNLITGIGIITGEISNIVVIDIDTNDLEIYKTLPFTLPNTATVKTKKGWHFYYRFTSKIPNNFKVFNNNGVNIGDTRSNGGYIVAPPSKREDGFEYTWSQTLDNLATLPPDFILNSQSARKESFSQIVSGAKEGSRNQAASAFIGALLKKYPEVQWVEKVWPAVVAWNNANNPPLPQSELETVFRSITAREKKGQEKVYQPTTFDVIRKKTPNPNPFIVESLVVEKAVTVIHGSTGSGKSLVLLKLIDDVSMGNKFLDTFSVKKVNCLLLDLEMTEDDCIVRIQTICSPNNQSYLVTEKAFKITNPDSYSWLKNFVQANKIGLVAFDTFSKIHDGEENSNSEMTPVMSLLVQFAIETNCAVVVLHHVNKSKDATGLSRGRGASAIADNAASYLSITSRNVISSVDGNRTIAMQVVQEKARRLTSVDAFNLSIIYDKQTNKTTFIYGGETVKDQPDILRARKDLVDHVKTYPGQMRKEIFTELGKHYPNSLLSTVIDDLKKEEVLREAKGPKNSKILFYSENDSRLQDLLTNAFD